MADPLDQLTPDESLRADNEIKLLKLDLEHNVQFDHFDDDTPPEDVGAFLDSILALEEMHKNPQEKSVYHIIGRPAFQLADALTEAEIPLALDRLMERMAEHNLFLDILAPADYDARTLYRFLTEELFQHETTHMGGGWNTNFIYEEFHQNHRYDIGRRTEDFIDKLVRSNFESLKYCLANSLLDREYGRLDDQVKPEVLARLIDLTESWWPKTVQGGSCTDIVVADDAETARATLHLQLGITNITSEGTILIGTMLFSRRYECWSIEQVLLGNWSLKP